MFDGICGVNEAGDAGDAEEAEMSEEIVIIGGSNVLTASGGDGTICVMAPRTTASRLSSARGGISTIFSMTRSALVDNTRSGSSSSPYKDMSRDFMLAVALPILAKWI